MPDNPVMKHLQKAVEHAKKVQAAASTIGKEVRATKGESEEIAKE